MRFSLHRIADLQVAFGEESLIVFFPETSRLVQINGFHHSPEDLKTDPAGILELYGRLAELQKSLNAQIVQAYWNTPKAHVSALNLNLTDRCNLACVYCYARGGNYQRLQQEFSPDGAVKAVSSAFAQADPEQDFRIEFFGGEPFLNTPAIEAVLRLQQKSRAWKNHPRRTHNRVSSNLTHLDEPLLGLIAESKMILSISIDGTQDAQDDQRPFKDGSPSYALIMDHVRTVRERCPENTIIARMTVYRHDEHLTDMLRELASTGIFDYASIYPAAIHTDEKKDIGNSYFSRAFHEQFLRIADEYSNLLKLGRFKGVLELNRYCQLLLTGKLALNHCRAGSGYFTASHVPINP